jgi:predicted Zn finger-like uncharacterized protein
LIVTCEECSTSFQLDASRIPPEGARVRCSRCKHAFFLPHPTTSQTDAVHSIAADAAAGTTAGAPPPTSDLDQAGTPAGGETTGASPEPEPEEEDWQFNEEVRIAGDDDNPEPSADPEVEAALGEDFDPGTDFDEDFDASDLTEAVGPDALEEPGFSQGDAVAVDPAELSASGLELDTDDGAEPPPGSVPDESGLGPIDEFDSLMEEGGLELDSSTEGVEPEPVAAAAPEAAPPGRHAANGAADDLGDPESWDLVGSDAGAPSPGTIGGLVGSFGADAGRRSLGISSDFLDSFESSPYEEDEEEEPSTLMRLAGRVGRGIGWVVTLAMIAGVLHMVFQSEMARWVETGQSVRIDSFVAETTNSGWVETSRAGNVLVVHGQARNVGGDSLWPQALQLAFFDGAGERLAVRPLPVGLPLEESVLREAEPEVLEAARVAAVDGFMRTPLAAAEVRRFEVVVGELPAGARRVLLEVGEWAPSPVVMPKVAEEELVSGEG